MRAIIHPGFFTDWFAPNCRIAISSESVSGQQCRINGLRCSRSAIPAGKSLPKFHPTRINPLQAGQNAAALLFDFGTVDIR
jgi:hypothetical protein